MSRRLSRVRSVLLLATLGTVLMAAPGLPAGAFIGAPPNAPGSAGGFTATSIYNNGDILRGLADDGHGHLYASTSGGQIIKMNLDGSGVQVFTVGSGEIMGVTVDTDGHVWFTSLSNNAVNEMNSDGSHVHVVAGGFNGPSGVVFDQYGHMYVAEYGGNDVIRANLDGSHRSTITSFTNSAWGIATDNSGHLFAVDSFNDRLFRMNLDGSNRTQIFSQAQQFFGVNMLPDGHIVVGGFGAGQLYVMRPDGSGVVGLSVPGDANTPVADANGNIYYSAETGGVYRVYLNPRATAGIGSASVAWSVPQSIGAPILSYTVRAVPTDGGVAVESTIPAPATSATIYGLQNGVEYRFYVSATNIFGDGPDSAASNPVTPGPQHADAPTPPRATGASGTAKVTWVAPNAHGSSIIGYAVSAYSPSGLVQRASVPGGVTTAFISKLASGVTYRFSVLAINSVGISFASPMSAPLAMLGAPTWGPGAKATATALSKSAKVTWSAAVNNGSPVTGYRVVSSSGGKFCVTVTLTCTVKGLSPGVTYSFRVYATNHIGTSAALSSNAVVAKA